LKYKRVKLTNTLCGIPIYFITITSPEKYNNNIPKKYVIISCRVHAAETSASFILEGFIKKLISDDNESITLRRQYVFIIIPMLNPDGVIIGNSRCSAGGYDLNRCWNFPKKILNPSIYYLKLYMSKITNKKK